MKIWATWRMDDWEYTVGMEDDEVSKENAMDDLLKIAKQLFSGKLTVCYNCPKA